MTMAADGLAVLVVVFVAFGLGLGLKHGLNGCSRDSNATRGFQAWLALLAGLVGLNLWMLLLTLFVLPWRAATVVLPLALVALLALARAALRALARWKAQRLTRPGPAAGSHLTFRWRDVGRRWGDLVAAGSLAVLTALLLASACWTMSDVLFHWGFKAHQWWLGTGMDFAFFKLPWHEGRHADYPVLVPALFVTTAMVRGVFLEVPMALWSAVFATGTAVATREALHRAGTSRWLGQATLVIVVATVVRMTLAYRLGGSPDMLLAAIIVSGVAVLLAPPDKHHDTAVGLIAAVAVATKVEGAVFAALLIAAHAFRRANANRTEGPTLDRRGLARMVLPPLAVGVPWWLLVAKHDLLSETRGGGFSSARFGEISPALFDSLTNPLWHGLGMVLLLLPLALWVRATRLAAIVVLGQLLLYLWIYLDTSFDAVTLVQTSAVRLMLHAWPAAVVLIVVAADRLTRASQADSRRRALVP